MPPRIRIPTEEDFAPLAPDLTLSLHFPSPRESTTAILLLFHGLGDSEAAFSAFARGMNLPGVLAITVRGVSQLPAALLADEPLAGGGGGSGAQQGQGFFHWGDDLTVSPSSAGELDADPGFARASRLVLDRLVRETLVGRCGWRADDVLLFGFGQGGSLALGLAAQLRAAPRVEEIQDDSGERGEPARMFKGVVSVGGPLPPSMVPSGGGIGGDKARTPVLLCHGSASESLDEDAVQYVKQEFADCREVKWRKPDDSMPKNREEMLPIMQFFAERLRSGW